MKILPVIIFLPIFIYSSAFGQCKNSKKAVSVTYDVLNPGTGPSTIYIKRKGRVTINIINLNPSLYNASIIDSTITYARDIPALFTKAFEIPSLAAVPATTETADELKFDGTTPEPLLKQNEAVYRRFLLRRYKNDFEEPATKFLLYSNIPDAVKRVLNNCTKDAATLKTEAENLINSRLSAYGINVGTNPAEMKDKLEAEKQLLKRTGEIIITYADKLIEEYKKRIAPDAIKKLSVPDYQKLLKETEALCKPIEELKENVEKLLKQLEKFDPTAVSADIVNMYNSISVLEFTLTKSKTIPRNADEMLFTIDIKKKNETGCHSGVRSFDIPVMVCGGVKIDFSTGVVFNIGQKYFFDQKYRFDSVYRTDNTFADSVQIKRNTNNNIVIPSLGAFMHIYPRGVADLHLGGMIGASIGSDQRLYYHVGASLFIGREERFVINAGASGAKSNKLDGQYKDDQIFKRSNGPAQIPTEENFRVGFFVGLSWNLNIVK